MRMFLLLFDCYLVLFACFTCMFVLRNQWVFRERIRLLHEDIWLYLQLPSYDYMMNRFWIWDVEKFLK